MADTKERESSPKMVLDPEFAAMLATFPQFSFSERALPFMRELMPDAEPPGPG